MEVTGAGEVVSKVCVFYTSPVKGVSVETVNDLGPTSSPFKLTSVRKTMKKDDSDVAIFLKRRKTDVTVDTTASMATIRDQVKLLTSAVSNLAAENEVLKVTVRNHELTVRNHEFWISEVNTLPAFALIDMIRIYLKAIDRTSKKLLNSCELSNEYKQCPRNDKTGPCPHYLFLHGLISCSNQSFNNEGLKETILTQVHQEIKGLDSSSLTAVLQEYTLCKDNRDKGGHPTIGEHLTKVFLKAKELHLERKLPLVFRSPQMDSLLANTLNYIESTLNVQGLLPVE